MLQQRQYDHESEPHDVWQSQQHSSEEVLRNLADPLRILTARSRTPVLDVLLRYRKDVLACSVA